VPIYLTLTEEEMDGQGGREGGREECEGKRVAMGAAYIDQRMRAWPEIPFPIFFYCAFGLVGWRGDLLFVDRRGRAVGCWHGRSIVVVAPTRDSSVTDMGGSIIGEAEPVPSEMG
jgi:hypothetical protein